MSLKDLFGIVAYCAVLAWCASQVGFDNEMFGMVLVCSLVLSAGFFSLAQYEKLRAIAPVLALSIIFFCVIPVFSSALLLNALFLFIAGIACASRPLLEKRSLGRIVMACNATAMVLGVMIGWSEVKEFNALQEKYPVVSLENRLAYELQAANTRLPTDGKLDDEMLLELESMEISIDHGSRFYSSRSSQLHWLHNRQQEKFIQAIGFGVTRMIRTWEKRLELSPLQDQPLGITNEDREEPGNYDWRAAYEIEKYSGVNRLHKASKIDFFDPRGLGAVIEPREQVAGFVGHAFHYPPQLTMTNPSQWNIKRLQLVSLLKYSEPKVYELDHLPRMDQLSAEDVPTRPLDTFEENALKQLWTEKDLVISSNKNNYQMLGSLRAAKQCLDCHRVDRGTLLGAFSYEIQYLTTNKIVKESNE
jgi:hypothetical protein